MRNARPTPSGSSVADLPTGVRACVVAIDPDGAARLSAYGVIVGALLAVEDDAPFGGPRILRLGAARVALARSVARSIHVRAESGTNGGGT